MLSLSCSEHNLCGGFFGAESDLCITRHVSEDPEVQHIYPSLCTQLKACLDESIHQEHHLLHHSLCAVMKPPASQHLCGAFMCPDAGLDFHLPAGVSGDEFPLEKSDLDMSLSLQHIYH